MPPSGGCCIDGIDLLGERKRRNGLLDETVCATRLHFLRLNGIGTDEETTSLVAILRWHHNVQ
jgi:hypothetical protein